MGIFDSMFGGKPKKKQATHSCRNDFLYEEARRQAKRKVEANSRIRVINCSLSVIDKTNSLSILNAKYVLVCDHLSWMAIAGVELSGKPAIEAQKMVNDNKNENVIRIAKQAFIDYKDKHSSYKTAKAKENATIKVFQKIDECLGSIIASSNAQIAHNEILALRNKVEDIYSKK